METLRLHYDPEKTKSLDACVKPIQALMTEWPEVNLSENCTFYLKQGHPVQVPHSPKSGWVRLSRKSGDFLGIGEILSDGRVAPRKLV